MMIRCKCCSKFIEVANQRSAPYCNMQCFNRHRYLKIISKKCIAECAICGKEFSMPSQYKYKKDNTGKFLTKFYCSRKCSGYVRRKGD